MKPEDDDLRSARATRLVRLTRDRATAPRSNADSESDARSDGYTDPDANSNSESDSESYADAGWALYFG